MRWIAGLAAALALLVAAAPAAAVDWTAIVTDRYDDVTPIDLSTDAIGSASQAGSLHGGQVAITPVAERAGGVAWSGAYDRI